MRANKRQRIEFLIIDPQNSFCHPTQGELFVPGADKDAERLATLIEARLYEIDDIHVTLDTHHELDVAHPIFWMNAKGEHPAPFTQIAKADVRRGLWRPFNPKLPCPPYGTLQERMVDYVTKLEQNGRYQLTIWPPHCRIGTFGHTAVAPLQEAFRKWELTRYAMIDYVTKGSNIFTEHYSGVEADVPDPEDPTTHLNTRLIETLENADLIVFSGEASSHCVANTIRDIVKQFGDETVQKCVLLEDAMSPVPGFESVADDFFSEMRNKGMQITTTTKFAM